MNKYRNQSGSDVIYKRREQLARLYEPKWEYCEEVHGWADSLEEHLGRLDADAEWDNDKNGACERFLPIKAYSRFTNPNNIVLVGRTGTGKSSIFNRYEYAINQQEVSDFDVAISIRLERLFIMLKTYDFGDVDNASYEIRDIIEIVIQLYIIHYFIQQYKEKGNVIMPKTDYELLIDFMKNNGIGIRKNTDLIKKICINLSGLCDSKEQGKSLRSVVNSIRDMYSISDERIEDVLDSLMSEHKILVLVDSLDTYDITEKKIVIMSKALLEIAFDIASNSLKKFYTLKVAIPSEVYTHVSEAIPAKRKNRVVVIEWSYKDIIRMLAIKVFYCFNQEKYEFVKGIVNEFEMSDFKDYDKAVELLHTFLPKTCPASIPVNFETIPYCVKHTQKKPRQILTIFNSLIHQMYITGEYDYFLKNPDEIGTYVHKAQKDIIDDALNMYNVYARQSVLRIVSEVLYKKKNFMSQKELNDAIKEASSIFAPVGLIDENVKTILIESGIVGKVFHERYVEKNDDFFQNEDIIKVTLAQFEYQVKESLITKGCMFVLHPMCYEYYANKLDNNAWVYPEPADDIGDNIIAELERKNIIL